MLGQRGRACMKGEERERERENGAFEKDRDEGARGRPEKLMENEEDEKKRE